MSAKRWSIWTNVSLCLMVTSLTVLALSAVLSVELRLLHFFLHIAFGLGFAGLVVEYFKYPMTNVAANNLPALVAIGMFGISEFVWGGVFMDRDKQLLAVFVGIAIFGTVVVSFFGKRG